MSHDADGAHPRAARWSTSERRRKSIHVLAAILAAAVVFFLPAAAARTILVLALALAASVETLRRRSPGVRRLFDRAVGDMLRQSETHGVTGATTLAAGFALAALLLPPTFAATGILVGGLGDAAAALVGRRWGRRRLPWDKSLEGSLACAAVAFLLACAMPGIGPAAAAATAAFTAMLELAPVPFDDNLWLAPATGLVAWFSACLLA